MIAKLRLRGSILSILLLWALCAARAQEAGSADSQILVLGAEHVRSEVRVALPLRGFSLNVLPPGETSPSLPKVRLLQVAGPFAADVPETSVTATPFPDAGSTGLLRLQVTLPQTDRETSWKILLEFEGKTGVAVRSEISLQRIADSAQRSSEKPNPSIDPIR